MARAIDIQPIIEKIQSSLEIPSYIEHDKGFDDGLKYVLDLIEKTPTLTPPNEWVRVEDAMPPEHEPVLCIVDGKPKPNIMLEDAYQLGSWNKADGWIIDEWLDWEGANVTWWMPLPASPDKDNNVPAKTPNEPLTLEQLREMDGEPVYVVPLNEFYDLGKWCVLGVSPNEDYSCALVPGINDWVWRFKDYGKDWLAYRHPKEGEA